MKRLLLILGLLCATVIVAQAQHVNGTLIEDIDAHYIEIIASETSKKQIVVELDYGQDFNHKVVDRWVRQEGTLEVMRWNSIVEFLNHVKLNHKYHLKTSYFVKMPGADGAFVIKYLLEREN